MRFLAWDTMLKVYWMISVKISPCRNLIRITRPQCSNIIGGVQAKWIRVFSKSVEVGIIWQGCTETQVLSLKNQGCCRCVKDDFFASLTLDWERKGTGDIVELKSSVWSRAGSGRIWASDYWFGDLLILWVSRNLWMTVLPPLSYLIDLLGGIVNLNMQTSIYQNL